MSDDHQPQKNRGWIRKFGDAARGVKVAVRGDASFFVHLFMAAVVVTVASILGVSVTRWCLLVMCITIVLAAEMFNTSIERLARSITREQHPEIRDALDVASGAVLVTSAGAAIVGLLLLVWPLLQRLIAV